MTRRRPTCCATCARRFETHGEEDEMAEAWQPRSERPTPLLPLLHIRLEEQIEALKREPTWRSGDRNAVTLTKDAALRLVLVAMKAGARLHEHQAAGPITVQAISGSVRLSAGGQTLTLEPGHVAALESALEHEVEALQESAILVTLVRTT
jgi:quercetin dioxygenase-like cupin family protein